MTSTFYHYMTDMQGRLMAFYQSLPKTIHLQKETSKKRLKITWSLGFAARGHCGRIRVFIWMLNIHKFTWKKNNPAVDKTKLDPLNEQNIL